MPKMTEITCKCGCKRKKMVRTADVKRGWGLFFSKSCKAKEQERRTGQHAAHKANISDREHENAIDFAEQGWDAHKNSF